MKREKIIEMINRIKADGFEKEITVSMLKLYLAPYVIADKYRIKYTIEALIELGYFTPSGFNLKINSIPGEKYDHLS